MYQPTWLVDGCVRFEIELDERERQHQDVVRRESAPRTNESLAFEHGAHLMKFFQGKRIRRKSRVSLMDCAVRLLPVIPNKTFRPGHSFL